MLYSVTILIFCYNFKILSQLKVGLIIPCLSFIVWKRTIKIKILSNPVRPERCTSIRKTFLFTTPSLLCYSVISTQVHYSYKYRPEDRSVTYLRVMGSPIKIHVGWTITYNHNHNHPSTFPWLTPSLEHLKPYIWSTTLTTLTPLTYLLYYP